MLLVSADEQERVLFASAPLLALYGCASEEELARRRGGTFRGLVDVRDYRPLRLLAPGGAGTCLVSFRYQDKDDHIRTLEGTVRRARLAGVGDVWVVQLSSREQRRALLASDEITGLLGRKEFGRRALRVADRNRAQGTLRELCPVCFNVTNFREYNRLNGAKAGDACLHKIAETLTETFPGQLLAHASGDRFEGLLRRDGLEERLSRVARVVNDYIGNDTITLKAGIYDTRAEDDDDVLNHSFDMAKLACDSIARDATRSYAYYTDDMGARYRMRMYIVQNFEHALRNGYVRVFFQPVVRTMSGELCGFEALSRWQDPVRGDISPAVFVPVLEDARLVAKLDEFVIDHVARVIRDRLDNGLWVLPVSLNLSKIDFDVADPFEIVEGAVRRHAVPRSCLHVEITESVMAHEQERLSETIARFHNAGYQVWLDDFGSKYSSLNSLHRFDFDVIKIDMGFFRGFDARSRKIITSIVAMAKLLGVGTLAEGVEDEGQVRFLRDIGCDVIQGFYYGRPMGMEDIPAFLERRQLRAESPEEGIVYAAVQKVNFITEMPMAVFSCKGDEVRVLHENAAYRAQIGAVTPAREGEGSDPLALPGSRPAVFPLKGRLSSFLGSACRDGRTHGITFADGGSYYKLVVRKIAGSERLWLGVANVFNISDSKDARAVDALDRLGRYAVQVFDGVYLMDGEHDRIDVLRCVHDRVLPGQVFHGIAPSMRAFADELVHADDRARFLRFADADELRRRYDASDRSEVCDLFRVRREDGAYHWTVFYAVVMSEGAPRSILLCEREDMWEAKDDRDRLLPVMLDSLGVAPAADPAAAHDDSRALLLAARRCSDVKFFWKSDDLRFLGGSDALLRYFGIPDVGELVGKSDAELGWHTDCAQVIQKDRRIVHTGECDRDRLEHVLVHGEPRLVSVTEFPFYRGNRIAGVAGYLMDAEDASSRTHAADVDAETGCLNERGMLGALMLFHDAQTLHGENYEALLMTVADYPQVCRVIGEHDASRLPRAIADALLARAANGTLVARMAACRFMCLCKEGNASLLEGLASAASDAVREFAASVGGVVSPALVRAVAWGSESREADGVLELLRRRLREAEASRFGEPSLAAGDGVRFAPECYDELPEVVFLADPKTHEIVYANRACREWYGISETKLAADGCRCYEVLEGRDAPCERCLNDQLRFNAFDCRFVLSGKTGGSLLTRNTLVSWRGRSLRFTLAFNLSDYVRSSADADLQALYEIGAYDAISAGINEPDPDQGIRRMIEHISQYLASERIMVFQEGHDSTVSCVYEWCRPGEVPLIDELQGIRRMDVEPLYRLFKTHDVVMVSDFAAFSRENADIRLRIPGVRNFVSGHLVMSGMSQGFTLVTNVAPNVFEGMETLLSTLTSFIAVMLRNRGFLRAATEQSMRDPLTGALNRRGLRRFFETWDREGPLALISCDLNGLKRVNDERGHAAGDDLIEESVRALIEVFDEDHVVRMGGDEFVVIAQGYDEEHARRVIERIKGEFAYRGISVAAGYAMWDAVAGEGAREDGPLAGAPGRASRDAGGRASLDEQLDALVDAADRSMYQDKARMHRDGGNGARGLLSASETRPASR